MRMRSGLESEGQRRRNAMSAAQSITTAVSNQFNTPIVTAVVLPYAHGA
jgi:hypothetical protein